jgi:DNA-directed RNA polymerase subunit RPC12/RpoP
MAVRYRCPDSDCRKTFPWDSADDPPSLCPHCGYRYAERDDTVVYMPNILSDRSKSIEKVARGVMDGSEVRAELAAEAAGCSVSDMSALKVTNLNDGRHSEFATKDVSNPVTEVMAAAPGLTGFQANGAAFAAGTSQGPYARAGAGFASKLTNLHQTHKRTIAESGKRK